MCGRFSLATNLDELANQFGFDSMLMESRYQERNNIIPGHRILTVASGTEAGMKRAQIMRWGMHATTQGPIRQNAKPIYNARSETAHAKPTFAQAYAERRCIIPADAFYEMEQDEEGGRSMVRLRKADGTAFAMAGIWNPGRNYGENTGGDCVSLTTEPNSLVAQVHNRMPVILELEDIDEWIHPKTKPGRLKQLTAHREWDGMSLGRQVATAA